MGENWDSTCTLAGPMKLLVFFVNIFLLDGRLHNCLVHYFGFELCSLQLTDELCLKATHISSQPGVQFFQAASVPIAACFPLISGNPNAF